MTEQEKKDEILNETKALNQLKLRRAYTPKNHPRRKSVEILVEMAEDALTARRKKYNLMPV